MISGSAPQARLPQRLTPAGESQLEMVQKLQLDAEQHLELLQHCRSRRIDFLSTPFDFASVELLVEQSQLPLLKIASGEITNAPLLLKIALTGTNVLMSTGISSLGEVEAALAVLAYGFLHPDGWPSPAAIRDSFASPDGQQALRAKVSCCTALRVPGPLVRDRSPAMNPAPGVQTPCLGTPTTAGGSPCRSPPPPGEQR